MTFELTRAMPNGLAVHRLNHSATSSTYVSQLNKTNISFLNSEKYKNLNFCFVKKSKLIDQVVKPDSIPASPIPEYEIQLQVELLLDEDHDEVAEHLHVHEDRSPHHRHHPWNRRTMPR